MKSKNPILECPNCDEKNEVDIDDTTTICAYCITMLQFEIDNDGNVLYVNEIDYL